MSRLFEVPCPDCDQRLVGNGEGDLECPTCRRAYHARMGQLFASTPTEAS